MRQDRTSVGRAPRPVVLAILLTAALVSANGCASKSSTSTSSASSVPAASVPGSGGAPASSVPSSATLVGTWSTGTTYSGPVQPFVTFVADGSWTASDGCNRVQGTWKVTGPGTLAVTSGPQTMMACEGAPIPATVANATGYQIDSGKLTLTDNTGKQLMVLVPAQAQPGVDSSTSQPAG